MLLDSSFSEQTSSARILLGNNMGRDMLNMIVTQRDPTLHQIVTESRSLMAMTFGPVHPQGAQRSAGGSYVKRSRLGAERSSAPDRPLRVDIPQSERRVVGSCVLFDALS